MLIICNLINYFFNYKILFYGYIIKFCCYVDLDVIKTKLFNNPMNIVS